MDRFVNKKIEKQTIYEIYRACRLCGAGGGYKMPIIQNVVNLDNCDVELKQKIRECVQIEVQPEDKMPPLICELCVDKVNDFYEFLEMCRLTNKRTRLRLGLPPQAMPRGAPDAGDCILGVTEPVFVNDEDSNEPLATRGRPPGPRRPQGPRHGAPGKEDPGRKSKDVRVKVEQESPTRTRRGGRADPDNVALSGLQSRLKRSKSPPPKSILKKEKKPEPAPQARRLKRAREPDGRDAPAKRVKISLKPLPPRSAKLARQKEEAERSRAKRREAKQREAKQREAEAKQREAERQAKCLVCGGLFKSQQAMMSHRRCHVVTFTNPKLACNACGLWFVNTEQAAAHHRRHARGQRYRCRRCRLAFTAPAAYDRHVETSKCLWEEVPDVRCEACWRTFPTEPLRRDHRCAGESARPAVCVKCNKSFSSRGTLANHAKRCKKGEVKIPASLRARLRSVRVRIARCDPLLARRRRQHYDVSAVPADFGLDKNCVYPYLPAELRVKREPADCMVKINDLDFGSYLHWDSDDESAESEDNLDSLDLGVFKKPKSLAACALRTIFSPKFLGKVPRKHRRVKIETIIESTIDSLSDLNLNDVSSKISDKFDKKGDENDDDLFPVMDSDEQVTNADFDSLFSDKLESDKSAVADKALGGKDSEESENVKESDGLVSGAKEVLDEEKNDSVDAISNNDVSMKDSTNDSIDKNVDKENDLDSENGESKDRSNNADDSDKNASVETINNLEELTDSSQTKVDETPSENRDENVDQVVSNEVEENSNKSEKSVENQDSEIDRSIDNDQENNEINKESAINEEKSEKSSEEPETQMENSVSTNALPEAETEKANEETKVSTDDNNTEENTDKNISKEDANESSKVNGDVENDDVALNMNDLEDFSGDEFDDCELMAQLDAQIGEKKKDEKEKETDENKEGNEQEKQSEEKVEKVPEAETVNNDVEKTEMDISERKETDVVEQKETDTSVSEQKMDVNEETETDISEKKAIDLSEKKEIVVSENQALDLSEKKEIEISETVKVSAINEDNETDIGKDKDKIMLEDLLLKEDTKSMDLDSISDDEFDFND